MSTTSPTISSSSDTYTASEWTQRTMWSDLMQQKGLLIGLGVAVLAVWFFTRRSAPEERAARDLVRDWRRVDDPDDARDLLAHNVPTILRPALLVVVEQLRDQVERGFRAIEREIERL